MTDRVPVIPYRVIERIAREDVPPIKPVVPMDPERLLRLPSVNGVPIDEVEDALRPSGSAGSVEGFTGPEGRDDFRVSLARNCAVLNALDLTADQVTRPLRILTRLQELKLLRGTNRVELFPGRFVRVIIPGAVQSQPSPFGNFVFPAHDVSITNEETGYRKDNINRLIGDMGARYVFFEGAATPWCVLPEELAQAWGLRTANEVTEALQHVDPQFDFQRYAAMYQEERFGEVTPYHSNPDEPPLPVIAARDAPPDIAEAQRLDRLGMRRIGGTQMLEHADFLVDCSAGPRTYRDMLGFLIRHNNRPAAIRMRHNDMRESAHDVCPRLLIRHDDDWGTSYTIADLDGIGTIQGGIDSEHNKIHREMPRLEAMPMSEQLQLGGFALTTHVTDRDFYRLTTPRGEFIAVVSNGQLTNLYGSADTPGQVHPLIANGRIVSLHEASPAHGGSDPVSAGLRFQCGPYLADSADLLERLALVRQPSADEKVWLIQRDPHAADRMGFGWYPQGRIPANDPLLAPRAEAHQTGRPPQSL